MGRWPGLQPELGQGCIPAPMKIDVLTLFPGMFAGPLDESIIKRARDESDPDTGKPYLEWKGKKRK